MYAIKRINKEVNELIHYYKLSFNNYNERDYNDKRFQIEIYLNSNITIRFILNKTYPFSPPDIFINDKKYYLFVMDLPIDIQDYFKYRSNHQCLCCYSITCGNKWLPNYNLKYIINEIKHIQRIILNYYQKKLVNKLCDKKNIRDMNTLMQEFIGI